MTQTRLIYCSNQCSSCIGLGLIELLSIAEFLPTLRPFVAFFLTIGAKALFPTAVLMRKAGDKSITLLRLSKNGRCRTSTHWQARFRLTIHVGSELFHVGNQIMRCFWHASLFADFLLHRLVQLFTFIDSILSLCVICTKLYIDQSGFNSFGI